MKRCFMFFVTIILIFFEVQTDAQNQMQSTERAVAFPEVPRVSAHEAYVKFKAGGTIIIHTGGEAFENRHILGAVNVSQEAVFNGKIRLPNFPKRGIEIFTYCYWGPQESAGAGLAHYMIERGYENVKTVDGGGAAMEKIFDYYKKTYYGGKIVNPRTGQVIDIKSQK